MPRTHHHPRPAHADRAELRLRWRQDGSIDGRLRLRPTPTDVSRRQLGLTLLLAALATLLAAAGEHTDALLSWLQSTADLCAALALLSS